LLRRLLTETAVASYRSPLMPCVLRQRRERLPVALFVILLILCLLLLGVACLCASDHHAQAIERAVTALAGLPALIEVWSLLAVALVGLGLVRSAKRPAFGRASPAELQRFLF
jgi:hypothetical protein